MEELSMNEKEEITELCKKNNKEKPVHIGSKIVIIEMKQEQNYSGKYGTVLRIDDIGQIHGPWGGCALIPDIDIYLVL